MQVTSQRASAILYNYLSGNHFDKPFLLPANVCPVVPLSFMKAGVGFEFIDIDESHAMSTEKCLTAIEAGKYSGLVFVHAYGKKYDNKEFYRAVKSLDPNLCIIDDCCLCIPELADSLPENVDLCLYSTGYAKFIGLSYGGYASFRGGYEVVDYQYDSISEQKHSVYIRKCLLENVRYMLPADYPWLDASNLQMTDEEYFDIIERKLPKVIAEKEKINKIYRNLLPESIQMGDDFQNWRFMIVIENRQKVLDAIFKAGLFAGTNFPSVSYMFKGVSSPVAEVEAKYIVNLFNDFRFSEAQARKICDVINSVI